MKYSASHALVKLSVLFQDTIEDGMETLYPVIQLITQKIKIIFKESRNSSVDIEQLLDQIMLEDNFEQACQAYFPADCDALKKERIMDTAKILRQLFEGDEVFFYAKFSTIFENRDAQFVSRYIYVVRRMLTCHLNALTIKLNSEKTFNGYMAAAHFACTYFSGKTKEEADAFCDKMRCARERIMNTGFGRPKNHRIRM